MANVLITGGSGMIGRYITRKLLREKHNVAWYSRSKKSAEFEEVKIFNWDINEKDADEEAVEWSDHIIHLAGEGVADKRWTRSQKKKIVESRTHSTTLLQELILKADSKPKSVVCASAIGYYGFKTSKDVLDETSPPGGDFLALATKKWEETTDSIRDLNVRTVQLRIGIVLTREGGALKTMMQPPVMMPLGSGRQWMPWIHIEDLALIFVRAIQDNKMTGKYNAAAPSPVRNAEFTRKLALSAGKPFVNAGVPGFAIKLVMGEAAGMVLYGSRVSCKKLLDTGFEFCYKDLDGALNHLFQNSRLSSE